MADNFRHAQYDNGGVQIDDPQVLARLDTLQAQEAQTLVSGVGNLPERMIGAGQEQPAAIAKPVKRYGKLACNFTTGLWTSSAGAAVLTQGHSGWDGSGVRNGIQSRTGQPGMLKVVPAANTTEEITLGTIATNMLTRNLGGKFGLWVYVESQPGYQVGGTPVGTITVDISTAAGGTNAMYVGWNTNQIREGWNFLKFVQRNPAAYVVGSGVVEYHPLGVLATSFGTGADTDLVNGTVNRLRINWANMLGATLYFDSMWTDFDCQPQAVLGNDGGVGLLEFGLPAFQKRGWVGYTAFPYRVWSSGSTIIPDLNSNVSTTGQALYTEGWDFINHTANHLSNGALTTEAELAYEIETARAWQHALDLPKGAEFYASPQSSSSRLSEAVIKVMGIKLQRHARRYNTPVTPWGIDNPHHIGSIDMGSATGSGVAVVTGGVTTSIAGWQIYSKLVRALDVCEAYGDTLHAFWHGITTLPDAGLGETLTGDNLLISKSAFDLFCADLRARELAGRFTVCRGMSGFYYGSN